MSTLTFDTLKFSQRLEKAGVSREHAIAEAEALSEVFETGTQDLATKADVLTSARLTRSEIREEMREMELRLTIHTGGMITPLLSNCYLHLLDRIWEKHHLRWKLKARIVRYADDFVVLCAGAVDAPLDAVRHVLDRLDLTLNETKTRIVDARQESFNFLGFAIRRSLFSTLPTFLGHFKGIAPFVCSFLSARQGMLYNRSLVYQVQRR